MSEHSTRVDAAIARLRGAGERLTPGRRAVIEVLDADPRHLDAEAIAAQVAVREPGVHRATIYRSLQALVDVGIVTHTHVPAGATIYHLTPERGVGDRPASTPEGESQAAHAHAHLQCAVCGRFTDVDASLFGPFVTQVSRATGFEIDPGHGALLGTCAECRER